MRTSDVFDLLRDGKPRTRAELAEASGLARSTVTARIESLIRLGYVTLHGDAVSTGGRPPSLLALNPTARLVAGIDVGATHIQAVLADLGGSVLARAEAQLDVSRGPQVVLGWVCEAIERMLIGHREQDLVAIGMGLPGPVEHVTGRPINPPIMPGWDRFNVPAHLQERFGVAVLVDNDVNIMALGERQEAQPEVQELVFIKVATGIGAGLISQGLLQRGAQGTAGDLGHVRVAGADAVECRCGNTGCLEAVAAGPALAARLREEGIEVQSGQQVVDLVRAGDLTAIGLIRQAGRDIGDVVATMVNILNPSVVVVGGQMAAAGEHLLAGIREVVYQRSLPLATEHLQIVASAVGPGVGVRGAVALAIDHALSAEVIEAESLQLTAN